MLVSKPKPCKSKINHMRFRPCIMIVCGRLIITVILLATGKFTRIPPLTAAIILVPFGVVIVFVLKPSYCNLVFRVWQHILGIRNRPLAGAFGRGKVN